MLRFSHMLLMGVLFGGLFQATSGRGQTDTPVAEAAPAPLLGPRLPAVKQADDLKNWTPGADGRLHAPLKKTRRAKPKTASAIPDLQPEEPLITVNGETLTWGAMLRHAELMIANMPLPAGVTMQDVEEERETVLLYRIMRLAENYIVKTLFAQEARRNNLTLTPEEVQAKRDMVFGEAKTQRNSAGQLKEFAQAGSYFAYDLTNSLLFGKLKKEVLLPAIIVTDLDIQEATRKRVEKNEKLEQINAGLRPKIEGLVAQIKAGGSFADIAFSESDCDTSYDGGEWGTFKRGDILDEIYDAAFALQEGELSDIVETPFSYHIIKLLKKNRAIQADDIKEPAPVVSVKIAHIMLEKKELIPPHTPETARKEVIDTRLNETIQALRERLLQAAKIGTPLPLY